MGKERRRGDISPRRIPLFPRPTQIDREKEHRVVEPETDAPDTPRRELASAEPASSPGARKGPDRRGVSGKSAPGTNPLHQPPPAFSFQQSAYPIPEPS